MLPVYGLKENILVINKLVKVKNPYVNPYPLAEDEDRFIVLFIKRVFE